MEIFNLNKRSATYIEYPYKNFKKYATGREEKRRVVGCQVGKPVFLEKDQLQYLGDIIV